MSATNVSNPGDAISDFQLALDKQDHDEKERENAIETRRRMERQKSRGLGTMALTVNYPRPEKDSEEVPFERLSMNESDEILDELEALQNDEDVDRRAVKEFLTGTLAEYCVDASKDAAHWGNELTYGDAASLVRTVAMGGNPPTE